MKNIEYHRAARKAIGTFPEEVQAPILQGLLAARLGQFPANAKALAGFGNAKVIEIRETARDGTYRAVYTTEFENTIYVLHAFQKKSKSGKATAPRDINCITLRLRKLQQSR